MDRMKGWMNDLIPYCFQGMFDYLDNAVIKLCDMPTVGTDLGTVKQQIEELKVRKAILFTKCRNIPFVKMC